MNIEEQIQEYIDCLESNKKDGLLNLHLFIKALIPHAKLWFLDGKDANEIGFDSFLTTLEQTEPLNLQSLLEKKLQLI